MSDAATLYGRGLAFSPRVAPDGRVAWSDGEANVRECIRIILMTEPNERVRRPKFGAGLGRFLFEPNAPSTHLLIREAIERALAQWEPRVRIEQVTVVPDGTDPQAAVATIEYRLVATGARERVALTVPVGA
jgi:phage baseplate assembly protein W